MRLMVASRRSAASFSVNSSSGRCFLLMTKKPKRKNLKPPGRCIFCGALGVTKEHIIADWVSQAIPRTADDKHHRIDIPTRKNADGTFTKGHTVRNAQGNVHSQKLKLACRTCNNGWMSQLEEKTKPILLHLIQGKPSVLSPEQQTVVAHWVIKTIMVVEKQTKSDANVFTAEERNQFRLTFKTTAITKIWLARYNGSKWRTQLNRSPFQLSASPVQRDGVAVDYVQSFTLGLGNLVIFAVITTSTDIKFSPEVFRFWNNMVRIWPAPASPAGVVFSFLTDAEVDELADSLFQHIRQKHGF
jgi:hypothetical protein